MNNSPHGFLFVLADYLEKTIPSFLHGGRKGRPITQACFKRAGCALGKFRAFHLFYHVGKSAGFNPRPAPTPALWPIGPATWTVTYKPTKSTHKTTKTRTPQIVT
jgi:hypothetical protein